MKNDFQTIRSNKSGLDSKESYVIARGKVGFLRVLGDEPEWDLVTMTASEDRGQIQVCSDQNRLIESALRFGKELGTEPIVKRDWMGRKYVTICVLTRDPGQSDEDFDQENTNHLTRFFEIFDHASDADF